LRCLPAAKNCFPADSSLVLLHDGASLLVEIAPLLSRKSIFSAGRLYFQQDGSTLSRTGENAAGE